VFLRINQNFQFQTAFTENQSVFPNYLQIEVEKNKEVLGQGRWKNFKINGYDYAMASGVFNWKISKHVALFGGHGKQKIGHGYRTFFISDQAFNFPFLRFDFSFLKSKIHYSNLYGVLMNLNATVDVSKNQPFGAEPLLQKKPFSYQYLSVYPSKRIQVALFQGIVWPAGDAKNNVSILPHGKKDTSKQTQSMGFQLGTKWYDAFGLKNLFLQFEYNEFTNHFLQYASPDKKLDYRHYNGPLSYNTGTSEEGAEIDFILAYRYKRFLISEKMVFFLYPSFQHFNFVQDSKLSFILQPKNNTNLSLGMMSRGNFVNFGLGRKITDLSNWFYFSFSTSLYNIYLDIR